MRRLERDLWVIYLLLTKYVFSLNTCESGASLGELEFGYILPRSAFTTKYQVSLYQCAIECRIRIQRCKSFNYRRSPLSCQLCEEDSGPGGNNLQPNDGSIHSNIDTWKNLPIGLCKSTNCSRTERCDSAYQSGFKMCVPAECPFVELNQGMTIEPSNETVVGTNARRSCLSHDMERGDPITTCLENNAEWSNPDFKCVCINPPEKSGTIISISNVEIGQNYTYKCEAGPVANTGQSPTVTCLPDSPSNSCDLGYTNVSLGGSYFCIKSYSILKNFYEAMQLCESDNAQILVITTEDQIADLKPHIPLGLTFAGIWDKLKEGFWVSWDGKPVNPFWKQGEPNGGIYQNCGFIASDEIGLLDNTCISKHNFVCSKTYVVV